MSGQLGGVGWLILLVVKERLGSERVWFANFPLIRDFEVRISGCMIRTTNFYQIPAIPGALPHTGSTVKNNKKSLLGVEWGV